MFALAFSVLYVLGLIYIAVGAAALIALANELRKISPAT